MFDPPPSAIEALADAQLGAPTPDRWVFFDVDGTVLRGDSFGAMLLAGYLHAPWRALLLIVLWPLLLTQFVGLDWRWSKSTLLWTVTVGRGPRGAIQFLRTAVTPHLERRLHPEAAAEIARWRRAGVRICYVSGSSATWLRPLLRTFTGGPATIIASRLRFCLGGIVIAGPDCRGHEKVRRIEAALGTDVTWLCAYGNASSDLAMLARARRRVLVNPRPRQLAAWRRKLGPIEVAEWPRPRERPPADRPSISP